MGVNVSRVYMLAFSVGIFLAAIGGAFTAPMISVQPGVSVGVIIVSFAVVIIGGLGSIEGAAVGALIVGLARSLAVHMAPVAELFSIYIVMARGADVPPRRAVPAHPGAERSEHGRDASRAPAAPRASGRRALAGAHRARSALALSPRCWRWPALFMPKWLTFLITMAAAHGLVSLGIVLLMRGGVVSFGQGMVFALGGYAAALAYNQLGFTDALGLTLLGGVAATLVAAPFAPLLSRYRGIFFAMLTLALSMVTYGVADEDRGAGRLRRLQHRPARRCSARRCPTRGSATCCTC